MCRKMSFLVCVVMFCAGTAAAVPIDDPNYNLGFEWHWPDCCGIISQIYGHTGIGDEPPACDPCDPNKGVHNWLSTGSGFQGVDVFCPYAYDSPTHCHQWPAGDGVVYVYLQHSGYGITQLLDGNDANAVITAGRKYTMLFDALDVGTTGIRGEFYSDSADPIVSRSFILPEILQPTENCDGGENELDDQCLDWHYDLEVSFIALETHPSLGDTLGIRFETNGGGGQYAFMDHVRLDWVWATDAFDPSPADGEEDVAKDANLAWTPGLWAANHIVYFNEDFNKVDTLHQDANKGLQGPNTFDPTPSGGELDLGKTYYWRIVEVNDNPPGGGVPSPPWAGDVWSFEVTGYAINPNPPDEAKDVPFVGTILSWTPGTDSNSHDVYFGTDEDDVTDANTSVTLGVFIDNNEANTYDPGALLLGKKYYWRIDEVNEAAGTLMKGKIWEFTVAPFLAVETFNSYQNQTEHWNVWKDYWTNGTQATTLLETLDANYIEDGNSMKYHYKNSDSPYYAEAYADIPNLGITANWTVGGLEVLRLVFIGDYDNAIEDMYVLLRDGSNHTGKVLYDGDPNDLRRFWMGLKEWNIELQEFVDDNSVDLTNISRITLGFGDKTAGGIGDVYFDNIRLYPSRCVPKKAPSMGSFRYLDEYTTSGAFEPDCIVDNYDLWTMSRDWLMSGIGDVTASTASTTGIVGHWTLDDDVGGGQAVDKARVLDSSGNLNHAYLYDGFSPQGAPKYGVTGTHHSDDRVEGTGSMQLDGFEEWITIPNYPNLDSNTITVSAWIKPDGPLGEGGTYPPIVASNEPNGFKICFGSTATYLPGYDWASNNELTYYWTGWAWDHHSELIIPHGVWSFVALVVEPTKGTLYLYDGFEVAASMNHAVHEAKPFDNVCFIGASVNVAKESIVGFDGLIDDVYFYNRSLAPAEVLDLAGLSGTYHLGLEPWRPDPDGDDEVNFEDFDVMANNWLNEVFWP